MYRSLGVRFAERAQDLGVPVIWDGFDGVHQMKDQDPMGAGE
jgi:hypothetical protein